MFKSLINGFAAFWQIINSPDNDGAVVGLSIGFLGLCIAHLVVFFNNRARLRDKDAEINRLVESRNRLEERLLRLQGVSRRTTKKKK